MRRADRASRAFSSAAPSFAIIRHLSTSRPVDGLVSQDIRPVIVAQQTCDRQVPRGGHDSHHKDSWRYAPSKSRVGRGDSVMTQGYPQFGSCPTSAKQLRTNTNPASPSLTLCETFLNLGSYYYCHNCLFTPMIQTILLPP